MNKETYFMTLKKITKYGMNVDIEPFKSDLKSLQNAVGGTIEHFYIDPDLTDQYIDMWIDDEGKLKGLDPVFLLLNNGKPVDMIVGNCVFTKYDKEGNTYGLSDHDMAIVREWLYQVQVAEIELKNGDRHMVGVIDISGWNKQKA